MRSHGLAAAGPPLLLALTALRRALGTSTGLPLPSLRAALRGVEAGLRHEAGAAGSAASVARDCDDVAAWLAERGAVQTAQAFAESAAALHDTASRALVLADLARRLDRWRESGAWAVHAWRRAECPRDNDARAAALVAMGEAASAAQRYGEAERLFVLAHRCAATRGCRQPAGDALRGLAVVRHAAERDEEATALIVDALAAYGACSTSGQSLAQTLLAMWVEAGEYQGAAALGTLLLSGALPPADELKVCALAARAAAALGWEYHYETFCLRAAVTLGRLSADHPHARPMLDLARAHGSLGYWPRAMLAADRARTDAEARGDAEAASVARRMIDATGAPSIPNDVLADLFPDQETEEIPEGEAPEAWSAVAKTIAAFADALALAP